MIFDLPFQSVLMVSDMAKQALGKGLGALIKKPAAKKNAPARKKKPGSRASRKHAKTKEADGPDSEVVEVAIEQVVTSPLQPRSNIPEGNLEELVESIRAHGIIQPLITRRVRGKYELIAGERRWRASQKLGLATNVLTFQIESVQFVRTRDCPQPGLAYSLDLPLESPLPKGPCQ